MSGPQVVPVEGLGETFANTLSRIAQTLLQGEQVKRQRQQDLLQEALGHAQLAESQARLGAIPQQLELQRAQTSNLQSETQSRNLETRLHQQAEERSHEVQFGAQQALGPIQSALANGMDINSEQIRPVINRVLGGVRDPEVIGVVNQTLDNLRKASGGQPDLHFTDVNGVVIAQNPKTGRVVSTYRVPGQSTNGMSPDQYGSRLESLTRLYNSETQQLQNSAMGYAGVKTAVQQLRAAGTRSPDLQTTEGPTINSLFYEYARLRDPSGRLSDQDVAMSQRGGTLAERARNLFGSTFRGRLDVNWLNAVERDMERLRTVRERELNYYTRISQSRARSAGINPDDIHLGNPFSPESAPAPEIVP